MARKKGASNTKVLGLILCAIILLGVVSYSMGWLGSIMSLAGQSQSAATALAVAPCPTSLTKGICNVTVTVNGSGVSAVNQGSNVDVAWATAGSVPNIDVLVCVSGGSCYQATNHMNVANTNSATGIRVGTNIPVGSQAYIKVRPAGNDSLKATSPTFRVVTAPTHPGTIVTRISSTSPSNRNVATSATAVTSDVVLGVFGVKSQNQNGTISSLSFNINRTPIIATSTLYSNVRLYDGNTLIAQANSLLAGSPTFNNLSIPLTEDVWKDLKLVADVNINQTGITSSATLIGSKIIGTDASYNSLVVSGAANITSADNVYSAGSGLSISGLTPSFGSCMSSYGLNYSPNVCTMTLSFTVTNNGNSDLYISKNPAVALSTSTSPATASSTLPTINIAAVAGDTSASYNISSGASRTFTYYGNFSKHGGATALETFKITAIGFGTSATDGTADTVTSGVGNQTVTPSSNRSNLITSGLEALYLSKTL